MGRRDLSRPSRLSILHAGFGKEGEMQDWGFRRPGERYKKLGYTVLRFAPRTTFHLSVQASANVNHYIVRGALIPGTRFFGE